VPPVEEQERIVSLLSDVDEYIKNRASELPSYKPKNKPHSNEYLEEKIIIMKDLDQKLS